MIVAVLVAVVIVVIVVTVVIVLVVVIVVIVVIVVMIVKLVIVSIARSSRQGAASRQAAPAPRRCFCYDLLIGCVVCCLDVMYNCWSSSSQVFILWFASCLCCCLFSYVFSDCCFSSSQVVGKRELGIDCLNVVLIAFPAPHR